jgi:hypothetical protein
MPIAMKLIEQKLLDMGGGSNLRQKYLELSSDAS